jgi:hypothetical protein
MNDDELDRLVAQSMYSNTDVRALDLRVGEADLMENVMNSATPTIERPQPVRPKPPRRRSKLFTGLVVGAVVAVGGGAAFAVVADRLSSDQAETISRVPTCGLNTETAKLVASTRGFGRTVDYWIVDGPEQYGDFLFEDGTNVGTGGCGGMGRATAHPTLPWTNYAFGNPIDGESLFWFFGQAPAGTAEVEIVMSTGSTRAPVTASDGHFVHLAELPYDGVDHLERIDAYTADGELIASEVLPPANDRVAVPDD